MSDAQRHDEPTDRMTRMCAAMTATLEAHPEFRQEQCIVFLHDEERSGIQLYNYEDPMEAVADMLVHIQAIFKANGQELRVIGLGGDPSVN